MITVIKRLMMIITGTLIMIVVMMIIMNMMIVLVITLLFKIKLYLHNDNGIKIIPVLNIQ